jgi:metallo-beta-lactamase class B
MSCKSLLVPLFAAFLAAGALETGAQAPYKQLPINNPNYVKPFPPARIASNLYYVGTYDLAVYLIPTSAGHILINTGINDSTAAIRSNIQTAGFKFEDIKLLLASRAIRTIRSGSSTPRVTRRRSRTTRSSSTLN